MTTHRWIAISAMSVFVGVLATHSSAQQGPPPPGVIRINVNLVQVDAVVMDSKGKAVTDLKAEDFEVLQDGKPQAITNFSFIDVKESAPRGFPARPVAQPRGGAPAQPRGRFAAPPLPRPVSQPQRDRPPDLSPVLQSRRTLDRIPRVRP